MKLQSILDRQVNFLLQDLITSKQKRAEIITLDQVYSNVLEKSVALSDGDSIFQGAHIDRYQKIDIDIFNTNIKYLRKDIDIILETLNDIITNTTRIEKYTDDISNFYKSNVSKIERSIDMIKAFNTGYSYTYIETFRSSDNIDTSVSQNVRLDEAAHILTLIGNDKTKPLTKADVSVSLSEFNSYPVKVELASNKEKTVASDIIGLDRGKELTLTYIASNRAPITPVINIAINKPDYLGNIVTIYPFMENAISGNISIYTDGLSTPTVTENRIFDRTPIRIQLPISGAINAIKIVLYQTEENEKVAATSSQSSAMVYKYRFTFNGITVENKTYSNEGTVYSKQLIKKIGSEGTPVAFNKISMASNYYMPSGSTIDYFVSKNGADWHQIIPYNIKRDPRNIINFANNIEHSIDSIRATTKLWSQYSKDSSYGGVPLFNILTAMESDSLPLEAGVETLIADSVSVERGIGDYAIEYNDGKSVIDVKNAPVIFESINKRSRIAMPISESCIATKDGSNDRYIITQSYPIMYPDTFIPKAYVMLNGAKYECLITVDSGIMYATDTDDEPFPSTETNIVTVEYYTGVEDYAAKQNNIIEIDKFNFTLYSNANQSGTPVDNDYYELNTTEKKLRLNKHIAANVLGSSSTILYASYRFIMRKQQSYKIFSTNVTVETPTKIDIYPFTDTEIMAGNFHTIDGTDCSRNTNYVLTTGRHFIRTTQPFKSSPSAVDVNDLTQKQSNAGINLNPIEANNIVAFSEPMKMVSIHQLANIVAPLDHRSFAIDKNKIFINYIPEQINNATGTTHVYGTNLACKSAIYKNDANNTFQEYVFIPETFRVKYQTRTADKTFTSFYYKIVLTRDAESNNTPEITKLSFNLI